VEEGKVRGPALVFENGVAGTEPGFPDNRFRHHAAQRFREWPMAR
jgi:hypothetical protein